MQPVRFLQHGIQLFLLTVVQHGAGLRNGGFAQAADLLDFIFAGQRTVIDDRHGLLVLIFEHVLNLGLLIWREIQLLRQHSHLVIDAWPAGLLRALLARLRRLRL